MLRACLCQFEDPADSFRTVLAPKFAAANEYVENLMEKKQQVKKEYEELLKYFTMGVVKAGTMIKMIDDMFVPGILIYFLIYLTINFHLTLNNVEYEQSSTAMPASLRNKNSTCSTRTTGDQITNKPEKLKKAYFVPHFCGSRIPTADSVMALWDLKEPELRNL